MAHLEAWVEVIVVFVVIFFVGFTNILIQSINANVLI